jgi:anaerobic selenocysteine-containing dehydrogenase
MELIRLILKGYEKLEQTFYSSCPLNCWDCCGFEVKVEDGKIKSIDGDRNHPITQGKICSRGRNLELRTNSPERLLYPQKKVNGAFVRVSWEQALDEIADKMKELKEKYGTTSILHSHDYANSGLLVNLDQRFFNCYGGVTELVGSICWGSGIEAQKWDFGDVYSHHPDDLFNSKHIVIWGRNVARTNMHLFQKLQEAKKRGAKLTVIDPIYNATAKIAHHYFTVKPGMDGLLALGIMKVLKNEDKLDYHFISNYSVGFEDLDKLLDSVTLEEIMEKTEVSHETFSFLARVYADKPVSTFIGLGMQRYDNGGNTIRLIDALVAVSGNIGIPGGGANYGNLQVGQSFDIEALTLPERKQASRKFTMMKQAEGILTAQDPPVKMIFVTCGNPFLQVPDTTLVEKAFTSTEMLVVIDQYMTDTALAADYVLPTTTVFETEDIYYASMYHTYANYGPKLVDPPGEVKSDLWIWTELAKRLGFGEEFQYSRKDFIEMGLSKLKKHEISYERFVQERHVELPSVKVPWSDYSFKTPSGKYEFTSQLGIQKGFDGKLAFSLPRESKWNNQKLAEKYPYTFLTIHPMRSNHSQHYHLVKGMEKLKVEISPDIAEEKGIRESDYVRVWNDRGEIKGWASIMKKAHPKTINVDEGIWKKYGGSVNVLTPARESDNGLGSTLYDCLVNIEKLSG